VRRARKTPLEPEQASDPQRVRAAAVELLARRDFASGELRDKLASLGYDKVLATEAVAELARCSGSQFDPAVVEALLAVVAAAPDALLAA